MTYCFVFVCQKGYLELQSLLLAASLTKYLRGSYELKAAIPLWLPFYETLYKALSPETQDKLLAVSAATIDRLLKPVRLVHGRKGLSGTKPGTLLKNQIPIRTHSWDISQPGFMEADTVAHCGNSLAGDFVWSLT